MLNRSCRLLIGSALVVPFATSAWAQQIQIDESQLEGKSQACRSLAELVQDRSEPITGVSKQDIVTAINEDNKENCRDYRNTLRTADADTDEDRATDREKLTEQVDVSREATIQGEAEVAVPEPDVDVQVPGPNVRVKKQQPQVDISQEPMEIELEQRKPQVSVEIPDIVVHVDIPAPRLYVLRSDPEVQISNPDPEVEVSQGEPKITVTQRDPRLDVDLDLADDEDARQARDNRQDADATDGDMATRDRAGRDGQRVASDSEATQNEPDVNIVDADGEARTNYDGGGEPTLSYDQAEPRVTVEMPKQPTVEVEQTGEAKIVVETQEERDQRRQQRAADADDETRNDRAAISDRNRDRRMAAADEDDQSPRTGVRTMTVGDLMDMEVVTSDGEDLGEPEGFIERNGETHLVLGSGGFLGLGEKEVPVRMSKVNVRDDQLVVSTMSEEDVEAANDFEYDDSRELPDDHQVKLTSK